MSKHTSTFVLAFAHPPTPEERAQLDAFLVGRGGKVSGPIGLAVPHGTGMMLGNALHMSTESICRTLERDDGNWALLVVNHAAMHDLVPVLAAAGASTRQTWVIEFVNGEMREYPLRLGVR